MPSYYFIFSKISEVGVSKKAFLQIMYLYRKPSWIHFFRKKIGKKWAFLILILTNSLWAFRLMMKCFLAQVRIKLYLLLSYNWLDWSHAKTCQLLSHSLSDVCRFAGLYPNRAMLWQKDTPHRTLKQFLSVIYNFLLLWLWVSWEMGLILILVWFEFFNSIFVIFEV